MLNATFKMVLEKLYITGVNHNKWKQIMHKFLAKKANVNAT